MKNLMKKNYFTLIKLIASFFLYAQLLLNLSQDFAVSALCSECRFLLRLVLEAYSQTPSNSTTYRWDLASEIWVLESR